MLIHTLALVLVVTAQGTPVSRSQWKSFSPSRGNFRLLMPGEPKEIRSTITTADGELDQKSYSLVSGDTRYSVGWYDRPVSAKKLEADVLLDRAKERIVSDLQAKVLKQATLEIKGGKGYELSLDAPVAKSNARGWT